MRIVHIFYSETEAQLAQQYLAANDVRAHIIGAKNYEAIVAGGGSGRYEIRVDDADVERARALLTAKLRRTRLSAVADYAADGAADDVAEEFKPAATQSPFKPNYFRKSVMYALCAILVLPLVFNVVSLMNARAYWLSAQNDADRAPKMIVLLALQIPALIVLFFLFTYFKPALLR